MRTALLGLALLSSFSVQGAKPDPELPWVTQLGAVWAGGVIDLKAEVKRDVTSSFAALATSPLRTPLEGRAARLRRAMAGLDLRDPRVVNPVFSALCTERWGSTIRLEALFDAKPTAWRLGLQVELGDEADVFTAARPAPFGWEHFESFDGSVAAQVAVLKKKGQTCHRVRRDEQGEVWLDDAKSPVHVETSPPPPYEGGPDAALLLLEDPDRAVAGLLPVEAYARLHQDAPRPLAAGVLDLAHEADLLPSPSDTWVLGVDAAFPSRVVFVGEDPERLVVADFEKNVYTLRRATQGDTLTGAWSKWSWSMLNPRFPAQLVFLTSPASAKCLDALAQQPLAENLATRLQKCLDLSIPEAGAPFRVRRERWREAVTALAHDAALRIDDFCADQSVLAREPFFARRAAEKNREAGPVLNATLGWGLREGHNEREGTLQVPEAVRTKLRGLKFLDVPDAELATMASVDTSFFKKLDAFDQWTLVENGGPWTAGAKGNVTELPWPDTSSLLTASRLHLRRGLREKRLPEAAAEVRHAARLLFSTEFLPAMATAVELLAHEQLAFDWAQRHHLPAKGWTPEGLDVIERARRLVRAAPSFYSPAVDDETFAKALSCDVTTRCSGLTESVTLNAGLETLLNAPFDVRVKKVLSLTAKPADGCSFALARYRAPRSMLDLEQAKASRLPGVVAGGVLSAASKQLSAPLREQYPR